MANTTESIPATLGKLRNGLIEAGFDSDQSYQIVLDLIRRGSDGSTVLSLNRVD